MEYANVHVQHDSEGVLVQPDSTKKIKHWLSDFNLIEPWPEPVIDMIAEFNLVPRKGGVVLSMEWIQTMDANTSYFFEHGRYERRWNR